MSLIRVSLVLMTLLVLFSQTTVSMSQAEINTYQQASALTDAEQAVVSAYQATLEAEEAGANVTSLFVQLNKVGQYLARARVEFKLGAGHFEKALYYADLTENAAQQIGEAAAELKDAALREGMQRLLFTMMASVLGVAVTALGSLWVWHLLKKRYSSLLIP